jgi:diacylglycerol kinase (ATP)
VSRSDAPAIRRALLIVNPGARRAERAGLDAVHAFAAEGVQCDVIFTTAPGHATEYARAHAHNFDAVFTLGGDGTAMEAITALADAGPPVGILPGGTGNVLARTFGIPLNVGKAVRALVRGQVRRIDLGQLSDGRCFAIGAGVGMDEAMMSGAPRALKKYAGVGAYVWAATLAFFKLQRFRARITVDGVVHEHDTSSVLIANLGTVLGGVMQLGKDISETDGVLTVCIFSPRSHTDALSVFTGMLRGTVHAHPRATFLSGRAIRIETTPSRAAQADGEVLGHGPLDAVVRPLAALLLVPAT